MTKRTGKLTAMIAVVMFAAVSAIFIFPARATAADAFKERLNVVFDDGRVMFYRGANYGLAVGDTLTLSENGATVAQIELIEVDAVYSIGRITSFQKNPAEGQVYDFSSGAAPMTETATTAASSKKTEETPEKKTEEKKPAATSAAKESSRRRSRAVEVESESKTSTTAEPTTSAQTSSRTSRAPAKKETEKEPVVAEKSRNTSSESNKKPKEEKTVPQKSPIKYADLPPEARIAGNSMINGLTGLFLVPSATTGIVNHARLGWSYYRLSDTYFLNDAYYHFGSSSNSANFSYGLSENMEAAVFSDRTSDSDAYDYYSTASMYIARSKTSGFSLKYRFSRANYTDTTGKAENKKVRDYVADFDISAIVTWKKDRDEYANSTKTIVYGLAADTKISDNAYLHGFYGRNKSSHEDYLLSHHYEVYGYGLEFVSSDLWKFYAEYMKVAEDHNMKAIGVRHLLDKDMNLEAAYLVHDWKYYIGSDAYFISPKAYSLGMNFNF